MADIIIVVLMLVIIGGIGLYLWREKKRGTKCIGCPYGKQCGGSCKNKRVE